VKRSARRPPDLDSETTRRADMDLRAARFTPEWDAIFSDEKAHAIRLRGQSFETDLRRDYDPFRLISAPRSIL
jgi:hypothetical protein